MKGKVWKGKEQRQRKTRKAQKECPRKLQMKKKVKAAFGNKCP